MGLGDTALENALEGVSLRAEAIPAEGVVAVARRKQQLSIDDLIAINFPVAGEETPYQVWQDYKFHFMPVDTCARFLLLGNRHTFESDETPAEFRDRIDRRYVGEEAYQQVLRIACGLESPKKGEEQVLSQFKSRFSEFDALGADRAWALSEIMTRLIADAKAIRANVLAQLKPAGMGYSAVKIGEVDSESVVLVIGDRADNTMEYLKALGRDCHEGNGKRSVKEIIFTHPVDGALDPFLERIRYEQSKKTITCEVTMAPFADAMAVGVPISSHIFSCLPLDTAEYEWKEKHLRSLVEALTWHWMNEDPDNPNPDFRHSKFVELGKRSAPVDPTADGSIDWMTITRGRFVPREVVASDFNYGKNTRSSLFEMAERACANCAWTRARDMRARPLPELFHLPADEYQQHEHLIFKPRPNGV